MKTHRPAPPRAALRDPGAAAPFHRAVWTLVRGVPRGRVTSYGAVAALLGSPRAARGVGWALAALRDEEDVPWWRVVNRNGEVSIKGAPGMPALQRALLEGEGVVFGPDGRIDLGRFGWSGDEG